MLTIFDLTGKGVPQCAVELLLLREDFKQGQRSLVKVSLSVL